MGQIKRLKHFIVFDRPQLVLKCTFILLIQPILKARAENRQNFLLAFWKSWRQEKMFLRFSDLYLFQCLVTKKPSKFNLKLEPVLALQNNFVSKKFAGIFPMRHI